MLLVVLAWGSNFSAMAIALRELPPLLFVGLRFAILVPLIAVLPRPTGWGPILAVGLFINTGQFAFLFSAMEADVSAGLASLILQSQAPITIVLAALIFGERVGRLQAAGIALACLGLGLFGVAGGGNVTPLGVALVLCGALSWSCGNLVLRRLGPLNVTALFVWASLVPPLPMLAASAAFESGGFGTAAPFQTIGALSLTGWLAVAYVAFVSTVLGFSIWGALLARHAAATITPFALLIPVVGLSVAAMVLGETVSPTEAMSALVVLAGLALAVLGGRGRRDGWGRRGTRP